MTYVTQPAKPGYDQNWETYGDALDTNLRQLLADAQTAGGGNLTRYVWDGVGTPTRPSFTTYVDWLSPVDPSQWMQTGDTWTVTAVV